MLKSFDLYVIIATTSSSITLSRTRNWFDSDTKIEWKSLRINN